MFVKKAAQHFCVTPIFGRTQIRIQSPVGMYVNDIILLSAVTCFKRPILLIPLDDRLRQVGLYTIYRLKRVLNIVCIESGIQLFTIIFTTIY